MRLDCKLMLALFFLGSYIVNWFSSNDAASPERKAVSSSPEKHVLTAGAGLDERLNVLRSDLNTYISEIVDSDSEAKKRFDAFRNKFTLDEEQCRCNEGLLQESALVKSFFNELGRSLGLVIVVTAASHCV